MSKENPGRDFLSKSDGGFIDGDDGDSYRYSDGSGYYHESDGSEGYIYSDGSGYYHGADGSDGYIYSDGSGYYHGADGSDGFKYADGSGYYHGADGSDGYRYSDGSGYFHGSDGGSSQFEAYDDDDDNDDDDDYSHVSYSRSSYSGYSSYTPRTSYSSSPETRIADKSKTKSEDKSLSRFLIGLAIFLLLDFAFLGWMAYKSTDTPLSAKECIGKNYETIVRQFRDAGFKNIDTIPVEDLHDGWIFKDTDKVDTVQSVSIKGDTKFKKGKEYNKTDQITIYYHIYPTNSN